MYGVAVDTEKIEALLKDFHKLTGIRIAFISHDLREYVTENKQMSSFCQLLGSDSCASEKCRECDHKAFEAACKSQGLVVYECHAGLTEAVSPIIHEGRLLGYLMMGQSLNTLPDNQLWLKTLEKCKAYRVNYKELEQAFYRLNSLELGKIHAAARIMDMAAGYILHSRMVVLHNPPVIERLLNIIDANLDKPLTVSDLGRRTNLSPSYLSHIVKSQLGISLTTYIKSKKIEKARELLDGEEGRIGSVAAALGFEDQNYFSRVFKRYTGFTPTEYRTKRQKKAKMC